MREKIGITYTNKEGVSATCVEYADYKHIKIRFEDGFIQDCRWDHFKDGQFTERNYEQTRIGEKSQNSEGISATCIAYRNSSDIDIQFENGTILQHVRWGNFKLGKFTHPDYDMYYLAEASNSRPKMENGKPIREYEAWMSMIKRCYKPMLNRPTYEDVSCCEEWLKYENFYDWIISQENYNFWKNDNTQKWCVDKDILIKGNKVYGPNTCCLVPNSINCLITKCDAKRGKYPVGVYLDKDVDLFKAQCQNPYKKRQVTCGYFETPEDAFYKGYKPYKEAIIKKVAKDNYDKKYIIKKCYKALLAYEVEITD